MTKKQELLKAAEDKVRQGGYSNFSFRELAADVGIKSASVHYHFPTKADLGAELARQYTDNFMEALGDPEVIINDGNKPIEAYAGLFKKALIADKKMCLCGLLGAESDCLPDKVKSETQRFFERNLAWLERAHQLEKKVSLEQAQLLAIKTVSLLEGAMMVSKAINDNELFNKATQLVE
jgi:TetR/AcrR family transcriptional repressor of nem operon